MSLEIFCCYARKDQPLLNDLKAHLIPLQRQGLITLWADTDISAGADWEQEIDKHLDTAEIILMLVSPDFIASDYCYGKELKRAMDRHERGNVRVIPIILRPTTWEKAPFGKLQALPKDAIPVTSWHDRDEAFINIVEGIRKVAVDTTIKNFHQLQKSSTYPIYLTAPNSFIKTLSISIVVSVALVGVSVVVILFANTLNSWVLGGLLGGLAGLLAAIPISIVIFNFLSYRHDRKLLTHWPEEEIEVEEDSNN